MRVGPEWIIADLESGLCLCKLYSPPVRGAIAEPSIATLHTSVISQHTNAPGAKCGARFDAAGVGVYRTYQSRANTSLLLLRTQQAMAGPFSILTVAALKKCGHLLSHALLPG